MSKYIYLMFVIAFMLLVAGSRTLYSENQQLKEDKTKLEQSLSDAHRITRTSPRGNKTQRKRVAW